MENLIIQTAYLGDLVLSLPLMRQLVQIDPGRPLAVVCRKGLGDIVRAAGYANRVIEVDKKDAKAWAQQQKELLASDFFHVICPHESVRTALLVARMKVRGKKVGFAKKWNFLAFDIRVKKPVHLPDALRQLSLLTAISSSFAEEFSEIGATEELWNSNELAGPIDFRKHQIPSWANLSNSGQRVDQSKKVFIAPGSTWATKRWTVEGFKQLASELVADDWDVVLVGAPNERDLANEIAKVSPKIQNQVGEWSVSETVSEFGKGRGLIANDSGAIHMAALAGLPTVAIFGPTTLELGFRPWQSQAIVMQTPLSCRPCGKHGHDKCPIGTHECMKKISAAEVHAALRNLTGV